MAPNVTSTTTLFMAEAAVCPTSKLTTLRRPSSATMPSMVPVGQAVGSPAPPTATTMASAKASVVDRPVAEDPYAWHIVWRNVIAFAYLHYAAVRGLYVFFSGGIAFPTYLWTAVLVVLSAQGITAGAHRLWAHRAYKARLPLRVLLMLCQTLAFQNHIYEWVRDHRVHHKFTDTDADPHNASRGFFFSHMGWLMVRKHPDVRRKGAGVDMSDLEQDSVVMFQKKSYLVLMPLIAFFLPAYVPYKLWGESFWAAYYVSSMMRYVLSLHGTWLVNSAAHIWGMRPVDKSISPTENYFVAHVAFGEGWHNYHHVFPWDYKAAELGDYYGNITTAILDFMCYIGQAYDLKTVSKEMVERRVARTGDGTHPSVQDKQQPHHHHHHHHHGDEVWGWGDKDMPQDDVLGATIINKSD
ncbi:acyl-CoA Delta-9 desaturase-like [Frankliniella occidentalis]|uniref:Acyl-CoA Delta-9 desaturase-like n=1 Tax=Frankliniella occidentalis TaxID=133901 RepID=A0A6J1SIS7_FRAOC|nr:acyl-CoA Delta-9 desaturase-like [Frankliniella occidentalis]XP_026281149.1 acyl-CoA Delta-9 desaturase-like [Frankliniella occidentalis]